MTGGTATPDFIDDRHIEGLLAAARPDPVRVREVLAKSLSRQRLAPEETAVLLSVQDGELRGEVFAAARRLKEDVYGKRIVLFAPLYVGDRCVNDCRYCGFRSSNREMVRKTLSDEELRQELAALEGQGHKRLILVWGEHPDYPAEEMARVAGLVYATRVGHGGIRRVNVNAAPLDVEGYRVMKSAGIGTYQVFQETYHHETYARMHQARTRKGDYRWRLTSHDRAMEAGVDDVGIGALFGLHDWRFEVLGLLYHAIHLEERFGVGPHTISFPRVNIAYNVRPEDFRRVSDEDFLQLVAVLRLAVPYTGLILTARESPEVRRAALRLGVSQIDAGSRLELGSYRERREDGCQQLEREQFELHDTRPLDAVVRELIGDGYVPSWCTSCYRLGRTGEHFMEFARPGFIKRYCTPNALVTLAEYLTDYASETTRREGFALVERELAGIADERLRAQAQERVNRVRTTDERDLRL
ncbi:[FeFe] hydrogenase H-cluster radical SAM maturase HydG [candidate division WOR-3 bacterium]|nr:[FeFe] hydrogenase H-cluster radical SAM maturase HydG [candidate division WOR-3 bacterium]